MKSKDIQHTVRITSLLLKKKGKTNINIEGINVQDREASDAGKRLPAMPEVQLAPGYVCNVCIIVYLCVCASLCVCIYCVCVHVRARVSACVYCKHAQIVS
jgi:hypothetical protein